MAPIYLFWHRHLLCAAGDRLHPVSIRFRVREYRRWYQHPADQAWFTRPNQFDFARHRQQQDSWRKASRNPNQD